LRGIGATVWQVSEKGLPDLIVGHGGKTYLVEVKMPGKGLTEDQTKTHAEWKGSAIHVVSSAEDALEMLGLIAPRPHEPMDPDAVPPPRKK
jgi:hypothetical protein